MSTLVPAERIERSILLIRGHKVILDRDLAKLYGVETRDLNKAVNRNQERFPSDFMIQLTRSEFNNLKFQFGTSSWGGTRKLPRAFTEQGVAMLSSVLRSQRAVQVNIEIMRTFVRLREMIASHKDLARRLNELEKKYDAQFKVVFDAIRQLMEPPDSKRRKYYFDGGQVEIAAHLVYELDPDGKQLRVVRFTEYAAEKVRTLYPSAPELREQWANPEKRSEIIERLAERGIDFEQLAATAKQPEADPFDLLCHIAFNAPLRTRRERADRLRREKKDFFDKYGPEARAVLNDLLEKYAEHGTAQFVIPDVLKVPPISERGNVMEIAGMFGGPEKLKDAVNQLQALLYAA